MAILVLNASPVQIAILRAADLVPGFLVGLLAGVWVDRLRRRPVLIAADIGRALLLGSIALVALTGHARIEQLYLVAALASLLTVFFDVAEQSYIPVVVGHDRLLDANSRLAATQSIAEVGGFGIAGWLVQLFTAPVAIAIDAVTFASSASCRACSRARRTRRRPGNPALTGGASQCVKGAGTVTFGRGLVLATYRDSPGLGPSGDLDAGRDHGRFGRTRSMVRRGADEHTAGQ